MQNQLPINTERSNNQQDHTDILRTMSSENKRKFRGVFKHTLGHLDDDEVDIIVAQILISLRLEGVVGKNLTNDEACLVAMIRDAVLDNKEQREEALTLSNSIKSRDF